ncbi:MAG: phage/plasmid primase, P4 family [Ktedonobacteraceae bacterium]
MRPHADVSSFRPIPALAELQARSQWVCWRKEERKGKLTKVPYNPRTGGGTMVNNPDTWASYEGAHQAYERSLSAKRPYAGLGYVFHADYTGIDLDHCIAPDGSIEPWAQTYLERFASYSEVSPSGAGIHILVRGTLPHHKGTRRPIPKPLRPRHVEAAIEMYDRGRFFTITGHHVRGTPITIEERPDILREVHAEMTASRQQQSANRGERNAAVRDPSDDALLERAMHAKNGATFRALWNGDTSGYVSQSEAELALCSVLAFWTGNDVSQIDRLFRRSALYRPDKWDRPARSGETYGEGTIARAVANGSEAYSPKGKVLQFRRRHASPVDEHQVSLPETDLALVLDCLRDEEEGDARLYAHLFRGQCIYDHTEGMWYEWQGHYWERDECKHALLLASGPLASVYLDASAQLSEEAAQAEKHLDPDILKGADAQREHYQWLKAMTGDLIGRAKALKKLKRAQAVLTYAQAYLKITADQWDDHSWLLACQNGVLDLRTGELHPGRPEDYIRTTIPTAWSSLETPAPRWEQFLAEVFEDREPTQRAELISFLQRLFGYGITGDVREHVFCVLFGEEGRNGKDTIQHALSHVLGDISSAISKDVLLETGRFRTAGSATPHICDLHGKRLAWASEPEKGARFSVGQIKEYSGGGSIPARGMYEKRIIKIKPTHLLILLTNHKPYADAEEKAFWDRLRLVTFSMRFVDTPLASNERKKDTQLWKALEAEASGILAWLVRGCLAWQQQGLSTPQAVLLDGEQYRKEQDVIDLFIAECCLLHEQAMVRASALFEAYVAWGKGNNMRSLMTGTSFGKKMSKRFAKKATPRWIVYQGIGLREQGGETALGDDAPPSNPDGGSGGLMEGRVEGSVQPSISVQQARQADGSQNETPANGGLEGFFQDFPINTFFLSSRESSGTNPPTFHPAEETLSLLPPVEVNEEGWRVETNPPLDPPSTLQTLHRQPESLHYVQTIDGPGYLTGNRQEQDVTCIADERKEALRYKIGVVILKDGLERFYYPRMVWDAPSEGIGADEQSREVFPREPWE